MGKYIVVGAIIVVGGWLYSQQVSIDNQNQRDTENKANYSACIIQANADYWSYVKLNGITHVDGSVWATNYIWDQARQNKELAIKICDQEFK